MKYTLSDLSSNLKKYMDTMALNFAKARSPYDEDDYKQAAWLALWGILERGRDSEKLSFYKAVARNAMRKFRRDFVKNRIVSQTLESIGE
jgi:DNA-directed RNA polymerase specialized sigma24 family protein